MDFSKLTVEQALKLQSQLQKHIEQQKAKTKKVKKTLKMQDEEPIIEEPIIEEVPIEKTKKKVVVNLFNIKKKNKKSVKNVKKNVKTVEDYQKKLRNIKYDNVDLISEKKMSDDKYKIVYKNSKNKNKQSVVVNAKSPQYFLLKKHGVTDMLKYMNNYKNIDKNIKMTEKVQKIFNGVANSVNITSSFEFVDYKVYFAFMKPYFEMLMYNKKREYGMRCAKVIEQITIKYILVKPDSVEEITKHHVSASETVTNNYKFGKILDTFSDDLVNKIEQFMGKGSGWRIKQIVSSNFLFIKCNPLKGSSYLPLPETIPKNSCINVKNDDDKCFLWSVLSKLKYDVVNKKHRNNVNYYKKFESEINMKGISYPVKLSQIGKIENQNDFSINVYMPFKEDSRLGRTWTVYPIHISENIKENHINLMLISDPKKPSDYNEKVIDDVDYGHNHYVYVHNIGMLLSNQITKTNHAKIDSSLFCLRCCNYCRTKAKFEEHKTLCESFDFVKTRYPKKYTKINKKGEEVEVDETVLKFKNKNNKFKAPFVIYADFEALTKPVEDIDNENNKTVIYQKHEPISFCYKVVSVYDDHQFEPVTYFGTDCIEKFIEKLVKEEEHIMDILGQNKPMIPLTEEEKQTFQNTKICHICEKDIVKPVRDHDHVTGKFISASCEDCNINRNHKNYKVPVIFHNLKGYDSHFIISKIATIEKNRREKGNYRRDLSVIPNNTEKFITFTYGKLRFIDSLGFMASSLESLSSNLFDKGRGKQYFKHMATHFKNDSDLDMMLRKGVYPYDYLNSVDKFKQKTFPKYEDFYSQLAKENIKQEDYDYGVKVFEHFKCKNLRSYHDLYLVTDVLLLADIFENFREVSLKNYNLDPCHYLTAPSLAWDAFLKLTKIEIDLCTDKQVNEYLFFESAIRGGISTMKQRYAKANNKHMENYDKNEESSYIMYLDANNLYGWAMCQYLPYSVNGFLPPDMLSTDEWLKLINLLREDEKLGYMFEVDLEYPKELHDYHNDYPMAPERVALKKSDLSPYCLKLAEKLNMKIPEVGVPKLIPNLNDKKNYRIHYRNLQQCLKHGMKLTKVHQVLEFKQKPFFKEYIDMNTEFRKQAKNDFEKDFFKLMNNSCFGKTMENVRERIDYEIVIDPSKLIKLASKNMRFKSIDVFEHTNDMVGVLKNKKEVVLDKPVFIGATVLDLSKHLMYDFHYGYMKPKYNDKCKLLFTDTDSLCYHIKTNDVYKDFAKDKHLFDFSEYDKDHKLFDETNKKAIGKMKDEANGKIITEFVGLKAKMYSYIKQLDGVEKNEKRLKGVKKSVVKNEFCHENYKDCLLNGLSKNAEMNIIRSKQHQLYSMKVNKTALTCYDDKNFLINNLDFLSYGHYKIAEL